MKVIATKTHNGFRQGKQYKVIGQTVNCYLAINDYGMTRYISVENCKEV